MFKFENLLAPVIASYVHKYIKNLKTEDTSISLWGGSGVFYNLDLRLDVLEQELQLPFTFVNGHIHELRIHVPWTKLYSEPIVFTINTIECILKLSGDENASDSDTQKIIQSRKTSQCQKLEEPPSGYVQNLLNKVIGNISIVCNNLILKYVEDDIVLSLNIKSVELFNVNDKWERAFIDTTLTDVPVRRVIKMQDLTVCLDKRDGSGKIETYQDPLLYRCSTTWRLYSVYDSPHSKYPTLTRINMHCEELEFSLTDQQLPMFLRLLYLCIALQNRGTFKEKESSGSNNEISDSEVNSPEESQDFNNADSQEASWGAWAWSFITYLSEEENKEKKEEINKLLANKIVQFGIFIGRASCTLKQTVLNQDSVIIATPKYSFVPLMIMDFYGCSMEFTAKGKDFVNVQAGVSGSTVSGLGDCVCGHQDFSTNSNERSIFLKSGVPPSSGQAYSYLSSSLFDCLAPENCGKSRKYTFIQDEHFSSLTEEALIQRFPSFAMDFWYKIEIPEEYMDQLSTITSTFVEESNWDEKSICRLVLGPFSLDVTSSFIHRVSKLVSCMKDYDYPCYTPSKKPPLRSADVDSDVIEQLEEFVPLRQYHLTLFKPIIRLFVASHSNSAKQDTRKGRKKRTKPSKISKEHESQFYFQIYVNCLDMQVSMPMYPLRLVTIADAHSSQILIRHCYNSNSFELFGLEMSMQKENENIDLELQIIEKASLKLSIKSLLLPEKWINHTKLTEKEYSFECTYLRFQLCEVRILAAISIYHSWAIKYFNAIGLQKLNAAVLNSQIASERIFCEIRDIICLFHQSNSMSFVKVSVALLHTTFQNEGNVSVLFRAPEMTQNMPKGFNLKEENMNWEEADSSVKFIQLILQIPKNMDNKLQSLLLLHVSGSTFCLEPAFLTWLSVTSIPSLNLASYMEEGLFQSSPPDFEETSTSSSVTLDASVSQTLTKSQSSILAPIEESDFYKKLENFLLLHTDFLSHLILEVKIGRICGLLPHKSWCIDHTDCRTSLQALKKAILNGRLNQAFLLNFPVFKMKNKNSVISFDESIWECNFPARSLTEEKVQGFPWDLQIDSLSVFGLTKENTVNWDYLVEPATIAATIALNSKSQETQMGLCLHIYSEFLGINLSPIQTGLLVDILRSSSAFSLFTKKVKSWISCIHLKPESSENENPGVHISERALCKKPDDEDISNDSNSDVKKLPLFSQLALSKLKITLSGKLKPESAYENFKLQFDAEEIISSLDVQEVYSKIKIKMALLSSCCCIKKSEKQDWSPGPFDGIILFCNDVMPKTIKSTTVNPQHSHVKGDNQPFMVASFTKALSSHAKEKWTSQLTSKEKSEGLEYISEIDIKFKSFDLILWMSLFDIAYQIFSPFIMLYNLRSPPIHVISEPKYPSGINFSSQNLPLMYIKSCIIQLYLPDNSILTNDITLCSDSNNEYIARENANDVLMLRVDCIILTSQVDNPLSRIVLKSDVYEEASKSKLISLPGAAIEDRQYQMDICGFALGSLAGENVLWNKKNLVLHHPLTMGENPALEWNIGVIPENRNISNYLDTVSHIISPLNIRCMVAPVIVCDNPCKNDTQRKIIVAGISVEVSVTSEICLYLSINQSCFIYSLLKSNLKVLFDILLKDQPNLNLSQNLEANVFDKHEVDDFPFVIPSCFTHVPTNSSIQSFKDKEVGPNDFVPFELLVTAGTVFIMFYYEDNITSHDSVSSKYTEENPNVSHKSDQHQKQLQSIQDFAKGKTVSSSESTYLSCLHPFLCVSITQPHSYIMCQHSTQKFESSCFDLQLCGSSDCIIRKPHELCTPVVDDFSLLYLETRPGELNAKTGIPPSFFTVSCTDFFNYPASIKINIARPLKLNARPEIWDSALSFVECFQSRIKQLGLNKDDGTSSISSKAEDISFSPKLSLLKFLKHVNIYSTQVVFELSILENINKKLILTLGNLCMEAGIETFKDEIKCFNVNINMNGFTLQMNSSNEIWNFLQPLTLALNVKYNINPWFQVELRFSGESILLNLNLHHLMELYQFCLTVQDQFQKQIERFKVIVNAYEKSETLRNESSEHIEPKRCYWDDDLRKGTFQFIQACDDEDSQPKVQEIVFSRASSNQPASMAWCYPEPRALTKVEVSPVPLQCEEGKSISDKQVLTCYLQYWNSAQQEYINLCDFMLSETEHCCLDLPDLNSDCVAVSDKWRVLLDCKSYIDDDGILEVESPCLSPLALAACMSIGSCFDPSLIPVFEVQASFELLRVSFFNHFNNEGCSPTLHPFEFDKGSPENQEFALVSFVNPSFSCSQWLSKLKLSCSSGITIEVVEFKSLTLLPLTSPVDMFCSASIDYDKQMVPIYDLDFVLHPCFFRLSQSVIHTLSFLACSISKYLQDPEASHPCSEYILPNYYIICNNIQESIRFGQVDTEECIILSPLKMHAYSWWCHKKKQMLRVSFGSSFWKWSQEFSIDESGVQVVMVDNNFSVTVKVKQMTTLQKQVIIEGQLIVHSELNFPVQLKFDFPSYSQPIVKGSKSYIIKFLASESSTSTFVLAKNNVRRFKLSITAAVDSGVWSDEVSFGENKIIKIPWENSFQSVCCHVSYTTNFDTFVAVFICPLFVLRSNLPIPLNVNTFSKDSEVFSFELPGQGQDKKLLAGMEWDQKLELQIHSLPETKVSVKSSVEVSVHDISTVPLKPFDEKKSLAETCYEMKQMLDKMWPYSFLKGICHQVIIQDTLYPCFEEHNSFSSAIPSTRSQLKELPVKVQKSQYWPGLSTLLIDLKPYAMIVNRLPVDLYLFDKEGLQWILPTNSVAVPANIHEMIRYGIKDKDKYFYSPYLCVEEAPLNKSSLLDAFTFSLKSHQCLLQDSSINVLIKLEERVFVFKLLCEVQKDIIVVTAFPIISVLNKVGKLDLALSCSPDNVGPKTFYQQLQDTVILEESKFSQPLLFWNYLSFDDISDSRCFKVVFYIAASVSESEQRKWSYPLRLHSMLSDNNRHTLSVSSTQSVPICISSHKYEGMLFLVVEKDPCPMLFLHNLTNMNLFYGQKVSGKEGKSVYEEILENGVIPMVEAGCSVYYSFPMVQEKFPDPSDEIPMLCLGSAEDGELMWSIPFKINIHKQFVHILGKYDFMVECQLIGHTVYVHINIVNRIEITAKEVRSRIALATNTDSGQSLSENSLDLRRRRDSITKAFIRSIPKTGIKAPFLIFINVRIVHVSFILCDEFKEKGTSSEVFRLNMDNAVLISRPKNGITSYRLQEMFLCCEHIQLDNQMDKENNAVYDFPIILQRHSSDPNFEPPESKIFLPNKIKQNSLFILHTIMKLPSDECDNIIVQSINVNLLPLSLCIEDTFCYRLLELIQSYSVVQFHKHFYSTCDMYFPQDVMNISHTFIYPVYFHELKINIPEVTLSLHASLKLYLSLKNSVLKFKQFERTDLFTTSYEIGRAFVLHYLTGALLRAGWVVGSLDILGNPAGFARAVGAGVSDFVYLPYKGLLHGPRAFLLGLSSGAASLFTQISSGGIVSMASLMSSLSRNMDRLCLDDEHFAHQEMLRHQLPSGISEGVTQGLSGLGLSLLSAVAGIADHPLQAIMVPTSPIRTASGIVSGLGKGLIGVFTKPIGGAAELISQAGYGLLHGAGWLTLPKRQYQPSQMPLDSVPSSRLKYSCKLAQYASLGDVLVALEATYVNENGEYERNILLLTSEALCILAEDEITLVQTFALSEIGCQKAESDQSTLVIIPSAKYQKSKFLETYGTFDRVEEYIIKNREENSCDTQDDFPDVLSKSTSSSHVFYLYPRDRCLFMTLFTFAKNKAMAKGFYY